MIIFDWLDRNKIITNLVQYVLIVVDEVQEELIADQYNKTKSLKNEKIVNF